MKNKRLIVVGVFALFTCLTFWLGSRYPDLTVKAEVGPSMILDGLGFDVVLPVNSNDSVTVQAAKRTVNWLKTNARGMLFGLILAAALASGLAQISNRKFDNRFLNTLLGIAIGAPMGLCVNCAAPVATGLHRGGGRLETSLAAMLASPTLNVIILSFLLTMLPWHLAMLKLAATLILLLVLLPLMTRSSQDRLFEPWSKDNSVTCPVGQEAWGSAVAWALKDFGKNLKALVLKLGPAMILAGALGSFVITILPFESLENLASPSLLTLIVTALIGTFLPVPIAFDVIICALLYGAGVPVELVATLLLTLGSFSIYSFMVVRLSISKKHASLLFLAVTVLGVSGGKLAGRLDTDYRNQIDRELLTVITQALRELPAKPRPTASSPIQERKSLDHRLSQHQLYWTMSFQQPGITVSQRALAPKSPPAKTLFSRKTGGELGLNLDVVLSFIEHLTIPTVSNRSIASGDIHGDGWSDIVVANDVEIGGLCLFANVSGKFTRQSLDLGKFRDDFITVCALVDINNDGTLDLFFSTINRENRILLNEGGHFNKLVTLPSLPGAFVNAVGFADLDRDGKLDFVLGGWTHRFFRTEKHRGWNYLAMQKEGLNFELKPLSGLGGNCHSVLLTDLDNDGLQDIVLGNDSRPPDEYYRGNGTDSPLQLGAETIERSTQWTMSLDTADLDNDLNLELFAAHIAYQNDERGRHKLAQIQDPKKLLNADEGAAVSYMVTTDTIHDQVRRGQSLSVCINSTTLSEWDKRDCLFDALLSRYWRGDSRATWAELIPESEPHLSGLFDRVFPEPSAAPRRKTPPSITQIPSSKSANVLLEQRDGKFENVVSKWGLAYTDWTWNAKFADLDLDGFQDLFLVNGSYQEPLLNTNQLYLNRQGQSLERTEEQGTLDYFPCSNYTYIDLENDGDLDIVMSPPNGSIRCLVNNQQSNNCLGIALEDFQGIRHGIGARVLIRDSRGQQIKELKASGGFNSFDAPILWFGLGPDTKASKVEVRWSDGSWSELEKPLKAGHLYRITREL